MNEIDGCDDRRYWSQRLENVLEDRNALEAFKKWMKSESAFFEHPINLHFAIIAYNKVAQTASFRFFQYFMCP
ncbi:unnamed protein product [Dracunculus medinensis]|uniref:RGS domain-containing protein n=1 Tax=Dracunculus medinensis TaxID=318479 RepID=A0A0N4UNM8_DRAME|nr:unnamed protein product [Dracunculus medinensis]